MKGVSLVIKNQIEYLQSLVADGTIDKSEGEQKISEE